MNKRFSHVNIQSDPNNRIPSMWITQFVIYQLKDARMSELIDDQGKPPN